MALDPGGFSENGLHHRGIDFFDRPACLLIGRALAYRVRLGGQGKVPEGDPDGPRGHGRSGGDFFRGPLDFFLSDPLIPFFIFRNLTVFFIF